MYIFFDDKFLFTSLKHITNYPRDFCAEIGDHILECIGFLTIVSWNERLGAFLVFLWIRFCN